LREGAFVGIMEAMWGARSGGLDLAEESGRERRKRMYAAIRRYQVDPGSVDEVTRKINEGYLPTIKEVSGFQAYYAVDAGDGRLATVSVFEDQAGAEESTRKAADFVRQNMASLVPDPPEVLQGEVVAQEAASALPVGGVTDTVGGVTDPVTDTVGGVTDKVGGATGGATDPVRGVTDKLLGGEEKKR
jgi:hypothetical protein